MWRLSPALAIFSQVFFDLAAHNLGRLSPALAMPLPPFLPLLLQDGIALTANLSSTAAIEGLINDTVAQPVRLDILARLQIVFGSMV